MWVKLLIIGLFCAYIFAYNCTSENNDRDELGALEDFYYSLGGNDWSNNKNWLNTNISYCDWYGLDCINCRVSAISFVKNNLKGTIPAKLCDITFLEELNLFEGNITGGLENIRDLKYLSTISIVENPLVGTIPEVFSTLTQLTAIQISACPINGKLPESLFELPTLQYINFAQTLLSTPLPSTFYNANLTIIFMYDMPYMTGDIEYAFYNMKYLRDLELNNCDYNGNLPILNSRHLFRLFLDHNNFTGSIPVSWSFLFGLQSLDLSHNRITDGFIHLSYLEKLNQINLSYNEFNETLPEMLVYMSGSLMLQNNNFSGGLYGSSIAVANITANPLLKEPLIYELYPGANIPTTGSISNYGRYYCYAVYFFDTLIFSDPSYFYYRYCKCYNHEVPPSC